MQEKGFIIDLDGLVTPFGKIQQKDTLETGHQASFIREVVESPYFKKLEFEYNLEESLYTNAENLSRQGLIFVFNRQLGIYTSPEIYAYMPYNPTKEQIKALRKKYSQLNGIEEREICEYSPNNYNDKKYYDTILEYLDEKSGIKEKGLLIFPDGTLLPFGVHICPDEPSFKASSTHEKSFNDEVRSNKIFKESDYIYDENIDLYSNALKFSLNGLIYIANHRDYSTSQTEIMAYVPEDLTIQQLDTLKKQEKLLKTEIQHVYKFNSYDFNDNVEYNDLDTYMQEKKENINRGKK